MRMVYGVTGYTGRLVWEELKRRGIPAIAAGRNADKVREIAGAAPWRAFGLDAIDLKDVSAVLHCAGPFSVTSRPMVDACLRHKVHYLDITGEIPVFEALAARDAEARKAGVSLLPGVGMDVVPTDCLAAYVGARRPGAQRLTIALASKGAISHGTATTALSHLEDGGAVRRGGKLVPSPIGATRRKVKFGDKVRPCLSIPWGDVATAWYSTRIPDIQVLVAINPRIAPFAALAPAVTKVAAFGPIRSRLQAKIDKAAPGPSDTVRESGWVRVWAEAETQDGQTARALLVTPEGYTLTVEAAIAALDRAHRGMGPVGFATPSMAFGADFVLSLPGVQRTDVD